jgi:hypothetical protein
VSSTQHFLDRIQAFAYTLISQVQKSDYEIGIIHRENRISTSEAQAQKDCKDLQTNSRVTNIKKAVS